MFEDERTSLSGMTLEAGVIQVRDFGCPCLDHGAFMRIVTIPTANPSFRQRMVERQIELCSDIQVTLVAGIGRFVRVIDSATRTAGFDMLAAWTVAGFAADIDGIVTFRFEAGGTGGNGERRRGLDALDAS